MRLKTCFLFLFLILVLTEGKRSGSRSRSRGTSSSSSSQWNRNKAKSKETPATKQEAPKQEVKPTAPKTATQTPIGWNVPNSGQNAGFKSGHEPLQTQQRANPVNSAPYPQQPGLYNNMGQSPYPGGYNQPSPGGYNQHQAYPGGYNQHQAYPGGYNPHQPYPGYHPTSNIGVIPPRGADAGHYHNSMSGFNQNPSFGYHQNQGGYFGGNNYGQYGGMKKSGGLFSGSGFRNVVTGMALWYMISGLTRSPYRVYNYQNPPPSGEVQKEFVLPANVLTLCNENATSLCTPGTTAICTQNQTILCAASINSANPCQDNQKQFCVNSTIPCNDASCKNNTADNTTQVAMPCFTTMTLEGSSNVTLPDGSSSNKYCVTAMAVPEPDPPKPDNSHYYSQYAQGYNYEPTASNVTSEVETSSQVSS